MLILYLQYKQWSPKGLYWIEKEQENKWNRNNLKKMQKLPEALDKKWGDECTRKKEPSLEKEERFVLI